MVKKKDAKLLADKIEFLLKNPSLCQQMGKNGKKKFLKEFTIERFENNMKNILGKLITN
jgi:glycosyltransferase involved in cell wall biosynthesis